MDKRQGAESVAPNWLAECARKAEARLRAMDPKDLGPAGRLLMKTPYAHPAAQRWRAIADRLATAISHGYDPSIEGHWPPDHEDWHYWKPQLDAALTIYWAATQYDGRDDA
jgi:hypothetical protein